MFFPLVKCFFLAGSFFILLLICISFCSLHLLSAMLIMIVYFLPNFIDSALNVFYLFFSYVLVLSKISSVSTLWHLLNFFN